MDCIISYFYCDTDMTGSLPQLSATEVVESLGRWQGMEDTIVTFDEMIKSEKRKSLLIGSCSLLM